MTRGFSTACKTYSGPVFWCIDVTSLEGTTYYYWTGPADKLIGGHTYQPYLRMKSGVRRSRSLKVDAVDISFDNVDLTMETLLDSATFAGAAALLRQYLFGIDTLVTIFRGLLSEQEKRLDVIAFRLVPEFELAQIPALALNYSPLCQVRYARGQCGLDMTAIAVTEILAETAADIFSWWTIGNTGLTMTVDAHIDRYVYITAGTGKGQVRRIFHNLATALILHQLWVVLPDATSKFRIVTAAYGVPKLLYTAASGVDIATADIHTTRTIGLSTLSMTVNAHASTNPVETAGVVRIMAGTGSGQLRRIKSNTATTITIADDEPAFSPVPDGTSQFRVLYRFCPKDIGSGCEQRGRTHRFLGMPTVTPEMERLWGGWT